MLDRSKEITLAGKPYRLWYGFRAQRRLGCKAALDLARMVARTEVHTEGRLVDIDLDELISLVWGGLHHSKADAGGKLAHVALSKEEVEELLADEIESSAKSQSEVIGDVARSVVEAVELANVFRVTRDVKVDGTEVGEAEENPIAANPSAPTSSPPPASE